MKPVDVLLALSVAAIWGMGFVVAKSAMGHFPPVLLMALRFALTAGCLFWFFKPPLPIMKQIFWIALVSAAIQYSLTFSGLAGIDVSTAAILVQLEVPFGVLLAWVVFRDRLTPVQMIGMGLAFLGTTYIVGEPRLSNSLVHVFMVIGGAFTWAVGQIMIKRLGDVGGFVLITWVAVMATPQLFIASWMLESGQIHAIQTATLGVWASVVYLGLVMTAVGYAIWYRLLGRYPVNHVMPYLLLLPVFSVMGGILFLDETLTTAILIGGVCTISGVAMISIQIGVSEKRPTGSS